MDIQKYNNEIKIKDKNIRKEEESDKDINKINDINTTKEEDSIYITDEIISYCSSPKTGLVSIKKTKNKNISIINLGSDISNINNTIILTIDMIRKEMNDSEFDNEIGRSKTDKKKINQEQQDSDNSNMSNLVYLNTKTCSNKENNKNNKEKKDKTKSFFKKKIKKMKENKDIKNKYKNNIEEIEEINIKEKEKKKSSKSKKKKIRKIQEKYEENKNMEHSRSFSNLERNKSNKNPRKKTYKLKTENDFKELINKKYEMEKDNEIHKEIEEGKSPKIIILDFSSSENNDQNEEELEFINKKSKSKKKKNNHHSNKNNKNLLNNSFKKISEKDFLLKKNKTKNENENIVGTNKALKSEFSIEKKFTTPKSKNSCFMLSYSHRIVLNKLELHSNTRKLSANCGAKHFIKTKSNLKIDDKKLLKRDKKRKHTVEFFNICASKNFHHNDTYQNKIINTKAIKENIKKNKKMKIKNKSNNDKKNEENQRKDSNKTIHNNKAPNKKFRHIVSHNYDKKLNNIGQKISEPSNQTNTPKNNGPKKPIYESNRNLANIKISSHAGENKDIHLEMNGKQETIINYTNQEMVDDENEYMVECFKILIKLDKSNQPKCKSKVNFNFENIPEEKNKKKIALFDLDETLVHCTKEQKGLNGDSVKIKLPTNKIVNVGLNIRPYWKEALDLIKSHYHIVVYTASHQSYADAVLDYLDSENKYFQYRLYRNHCVQCDVEGIKFYVKDLDTLNEKYNLKDVVLIDNSVLSFAYHLNNGIPIVPYIDQKEDSQLMMLAYYLLSIANFDDLTEENKKHINIEHFISEVKNIENEEDELEIESNNNREEKSDKINEKTTNNITNKSKKEYNNENSDTINDKKNDFKIKKQNSIESNFKKESKKTNSLKSEKALKIANDMKQNMADIYNQKYN